MAWHGMTGGKRLPGESVTRHNIYVGNALWEAYGEYCEDLDVSRSEDLREYMARCVGQEDTDTDGPENDRQAHALAILRTVAGPDGRIPGKTAKRQISQNLGIPKSEISRVALRPLENAGYIEVPRIGVIEVTDPD